jgi:glutathione synthase/RimK-type ligase-like ATP-grasp enzyme
VENQDELDERLAQLLDDSDLVVAQEFVPTEFDWRIGILDRQPLYACKYFMAPKHWQIIHRDGNGVRRYGKFETLPVELAPSKAVRVALRAANLIGNGLYGVDVKPWGKEFVVVEVNDNPNIDSGVEDQILKQEIYRRIMSVFLRRIEQRKAWVPE